MQSFTLPRLLAIGLMLIASALPALAINVTVAPSGAPAELPGIDSSQPDTIKYDIGGYYYLSGAQPFWAAIRFTVPGDFELRCIYLQMFNPFGSQEGVNVSVNENSGGQPGAVISGVYRFPGPLWQAGAWLDVELDMPYVNFTASQDFFVVFGPAPSQAGVGWFLYCDQNGVTESRSGYGASQQSPFSIILPYDLIVRAGGELAAFTDLTVLNCYNDIQKFFAEPGEAITYKAEVKNLGTQAVTSYRVIWTVQDAQGFQVFADSMDYGALASGATALQTCPSNWTPMNLGYFLASARVWNSDDPLVENNTALLEQGIVFWGTGWYKYDDGEQNSNVSTSPGTGWGNRFTPSQYPVKIDSVQVSVASAATAAEVRIASMVGSTVTPLWSYNGPLIAGANTIRVDTADINIFEGSFGVGYIYQTAAIYADGDPPIAAANTRMPATAYQIQGTAWVPLQSGDWMLRAFCSESSALPPYPVIRVVPDTLQFGEVAQGDTSIMSFWVYNDGGTVLNVTNITIPPSLQDEISVDITVFSVASLDSQEVQVTWNPPDLGLMAENLSIMNNATTPFPKWLPVRGNSVPVGVGPIAVAKPAAYALEGNFPNPFNPMTAISFELRAASFVSLRVYDTAGRLVETLVNGWREAGDHQITFDGSRLPSGIYFAKLVAGDYSQVRKMVLMK